jgi:hypothetical protein
MSLDAAVSEWVGEMEVLKQHLDHYKETTSGRFFEQLYQKKLEVGSRFPQHVWKPYASYFARYKGW